jgi:hypothetical protein
MLRMTGMSVAMVDLISQKSVIVVLDSRPVLVVNGHRDDVEE